MSFRLVALTPTIGASPGESVVGRVEIFNDATIDAIYTISVVGLAHEALNEVAEPPPLRVPVPAGTSVTADVVVVVPRSLGIGQHAAAFEATSNRPNDRAALTPFTVSIQSVARVELVPQPSTIRARRKAKFHLDVTNNEALPVEIALSGEAPDVAVSFTPSAISLLPGQRVVARGDVKGPRHWSGERTQHNILITARGRASSTSVTAAYVQRPLFAHRFRMVLAAVTVVALWLAAIGGVALWLSNRDDGTEASTQLVGIDTNGDGIPDAFFDADGNPVTATDTDGDGIPDSFVDADGNPISGTDTDGDGIPDTLVDADGNPITAIDTNGDGKPDTLSNGAPLPDDEQEVSAPEPQATILRGTVEIDGDPSTVAIALTPIELGAPTSPEAAPIGLRAAQPSEQSGKIWSARTTTLNDIVGSPTRRTVAIEPDSTVPGADGVWLFTDVLQGQSYEVSFSSPGYDTQSFVLTPRADGEPIDLDVTMKPANGSLSGSVVGPSGSLGGAEVRITDGTLEFVTTSASGTGAWSLQGVSTPGVYTVTATLRGYSTAVRQVRLEPGDKPTGLALQMAPGLGSITGVITSNATGLGGVTVTASNGETTLTTTTLTEGNIGFYSLPQLAVPADYTVQAELDGYVTNSRRVPLNGSLGGVDFSMTSTTSTLTGRVLSSGGGGIESAGLIVSTGDLQFRASTSPTGAFEIDRLPPGDYTITVEHFQHESATEFTTLTAGESPTPLTITLPLSTGPPAVGAGSLVVSVINEDSTIVPAGINNAKVTISRNRTADVRVLQDPDASAVTFEDLPIGTWTINVTAAGYNVSAPVTRSVGQTRERAEIRLQKLGSASGIMVNSLDPTKTPLTGYAVNLFRLQTDTDTVGVPAGSYVANAAGTWTTPPAALATGVYRIQATSPLGFLVRNDQILDTSPEVRGRTMSFLVPILTNAEVKPLEIPPIEADPYPTITGKIYKPRLNGVTVEYDALDDSTLNVTGACNTKPVPAADIKITDAFGNSNPPDNNLLDTFTMSPTAVAALIPTNELPGNCQFSVTANGRIQSTVQFTNIVASNGSVSSDRLAAAAMVKTPAALNGTVFWFDTGTTAAPKRPLGNVAISATNVITGFTTNEATATIPDPRPIANVGPLSTTSDATTGAWTLNGQVFGISDYAFATPNFTPGSVPVTINETNRNVTSGTNTVVTQPVDSTGFGVELKPPAPGTISGTVKIQTAAPTNQLAQVVVRATDPMGTARTATPNATTGDYSFANALAGTWNIGFDAPTNHFREPTPADFSGRLEPGGTITGVNATFTELATVRVRLFDKTSPTTPITLPAGLDLTAPATPDLTGTVTDRPISAPNAGNRYELAGIPVAAALPTTTPVNYRLAVQLEDFDLSTARTGPLVTDPIVDARNLLVPLVAGQVADIDLYIDSFKSITGSIKGRQTSGALLDLPLSGPADLAVTRLGAVAGDPAPKLEAGPTPGSFVVTGLPGTYQLTPSHPEYQDFPTQTVVLGASTGTDVAAYELVLRPSELSVDALTQLIGGSDVDGAVFDRYLGTAPCTAPFPATPRETIPTVGAAVIGIAPGSYCLRISKFDTLDPTKEIAFPAIVAVTVPNSTAGATPSRATVIAPLPALRASVVGKLVAQNNAVPAGVVELSASPAPILTSTYETDVRTSVNGSLTTNINPDNGSRTSLPAVKSPTCTTPANCFWTYTLESMPVGSHLITAPPIVPGYTLVQATQPVTVAAGIGPQDGPTFVYRVDPSPVEIDLGPGAYPGLDPAFPETTTVTLTSATGAISTGHTFEKRAGSNILIMNSVAPEVGTYTLAFTDPLHGTIDPANALPGTVSVDVSIALPLVSGRRIGTPASLPTPSLVRLQGTAQQRTGTTTRIGLQTGATMTLVGGGKTYTITVGTPNPPELRAGVSGSNYWFDVPASTTYALTVAQTGYFPLQIDPLSVSPVGTAVTQNVEIDKIAVVTVNVTNQNGLPDPAGLSITLVNKATLAVEPPRGGTTNIFDVRAGTYYAQATATNPYPPQQSADTTVNVGDVKGVNLALPRYVRVNVSGPSTATVTLTGGTVLTQSTSTPFQFKNPAVPASPTPFEATATATGYRAQKVTIPAAIINDPPVSIALALKPTVSGSIPGAPVATDVITATASGMADVKGSVTATGVYSIVLDAGPGGETKVWTLSYDQLGIGVSTGSPTVTVASTGTPTAPTINLTKRTINYEFTVTKTGTPDKVSMATTDILNNVGTVINSDDTNGTGTSTVGVAEDTKPTTWRVSHPDFLTQSGPVGSLPPTLTKDIAVLLQPAITGTVFDNASTPAAVVGATVVVCPSTSTSPCTPTESDRTTTSVAGGAYKLNSNLSPSTSYKIWATTATQTGSITVALDSAGKATTTPADGRITVAP